MVPAFAIAPEGGTVGLRLAGFGGRGAPVPEARVLGASVLAAGSGGKSAGAARGNVRLCRTARRGSSAWGLASAAGLRGRG